MFFKEKMLGKDQLEYSLNSTEQREPQVCWFSGVVVGFGIGLIGEYDNASFFFIGQMGKGTHTLSGTQENINLQQRRDYM